MPDCFRDIDRAQIGWYGPVFVNEKSRNKPPPLRCGENPYALFGIDFSYRTPAFLGGCPEKAMLSRPREQIGDVLDPRNRSGEV